MPNPLTWNELDSRRCNCVECEVEQVPLFPGSLRCKTCHGWYALHLGYLTNLKRVRDEFGEPNL
jgi:hypothetical protein